jgi:uncharacterized cupredoxin-like copper-binding protein
MRPGRRGLVVGGAAAVLLAAVSTVALAAVSGGLGGPAASRPGPAGWPAMPGPPRLTCTAPSLPGTVVQAGLVDMGAMSGRMGPGMMGNGGAPFGSMMSNGTARYGGMMHVWLSRTWVPAGVVSLQVLNLGSRVHELVVLPLGAGQPVGARTPGADGRVDESGSLGEVSRSCGAGSGDGIAAGASGWATLTLPAGRYELLCNLPGHYAAGMYAELDVR